MSSHPNVKIEPSEDFGVLSNVQTDGHSKSSAPDGSPEAKRNVMVQGIPPDLDSNSDFSELVGQWGAVSSCRLIGKKTRDSIWKSQGFGFVLFKNAEGARACVENMNGAKLRGRFRLQCHLAAEKPQEKYSKQPEPKFVVELRGLSHQATKQQVRDFLCDVRTPHQGIHLVYQHQLALSGQLSKGGIAFIEVEGQDDIDLALRHHREVMPPGSRYVEVFCSNDKEMKEAFAQIPPNGTSRREVKLPERKEAERDVATVPSLHNTHSQIPQSAHFGQSAPVITHDPTALTLATSTQAVADSVAKLSANIVWASTTGPYDRLHGPNKGAVMCSMYRRLFSAKSALLHEMATVPLDVHRRVKAVFLEATTGLTAFAQGPGGRRCLPQIVLKQLLCSRYGDDFWQGGSILTLCTTGAEPFLAWHQHPSTHNGEPCLVWIEETPLYAL